MFVFPVGFQGASSGGISDTKTVTQGIATDTNLVGFQTSAFNATWGDASGAIGSISAGGDTWEGHTIIGLNAWLNAGFGGGDEFYVALDTGSLGASFFTSIQLLGAGSVTLDTVDADYDGTGGTSVWYWGVTELVNVPAAWDGTGDVDVLLIK